MKNKILFIGLIVLTVCYSCKEQQYISFEIPEVTTNNTTLLSKIDSIINSEYLYNDSYFSIIMSEYDESQIFVLIEETNLCATYLSLDSCTGYFKIKSNTFFADNQNELFLSSSNKKEYKVKPQDVEYQVMLYKNYIIEPSSWVFTYSLSDKTVNIMHADKGRW